MDVIRSSRFWLALAVILGAVALAIAGKVSGTEALTVGSALLAGFGVGKATGSAPTALVLVLALAVAGCGTTIAANLERAHEGVVLADHVALDAFKNDCGATAKACPGPVADCALWKECDAKRSRYVVAMNALDAAIGLVNRMVHDLGIGGRK